MMITVLNIRQASELRLFPTNNVLRMEDPKSSLHKQKRKCLIWKLQKMISGVINLFQNMSEEQRKNGKARHYARISTTRRQQLVELVIDKNYSIGRASHRLKLKLSTAKMIIKKYRDHGTFFEKKFLPKGKVETQSKKVESNQENVEPVLIKKQEEIQVIHHGQQVLREEEDKPAIQKTKGYQEWLAMNMHSMYFGNLPNYSSFIVPMNHSLIYPCYF